MTQTTPLAQPSPMPTNGALPEVAPRLTVRSFGLTDRGRQRRLNEDQFVTASLMRALWVQQSSMPQPPVQYADDRGQVFIVADGMGGHRGGEQASALAVGAVEQFLLNALRWLIDLDGSAEGSVLREFKAAIESADACVYAAAAANSELAGMGSTLTMAFSSGSDLFVAHAGDSRCYLARHGKLQRLTHDDTLVNELVETGVLTPEEASRHQFRSVITNVVGSTQKGVRAEVHRMTVEAGDILLLCTDGVTGMVSDERIAAVLLNSVSPQTACEELIRLANDAGGNDNITAVVAQYA